MAQAAVIDEDLALEERKLCCDCIGDRQLSA